MSSGSVLHEEKAPFSFTLRAMMYLILVFLLVLTLRSWLDVSGGREGFWVLLFVSFLLVLVFWSFFSMRFRITSEGVEASMPPFTYRVRFSEIEDIVLDKPSFWVGWGLRVWGRRLGFISMHKVSVVVVKKSGFFRGLWLSVWDCEEFVGLIREQMGGV